MGTRTAILCFLSMWLADLPAGGQVVTPRGPAKPQELISLHRETTIDQALRIIQAVSSQAVVDPHHHVAPIGVEIEQEPWREALNRIAAHHGLEVRERRNYFELVPASPEQRPEAPDPAVVTLDSREVNISAVFFQADRSALRELGVDWSTLRDGRVRVEVAQRGAQRVSSDLFSAGVEVDASSSTSVTSLLKTFESKNVGEIIANPQIKVQNGKTGYIQVGSDFSVVTSDFAGNAITQFFSTGTILNVTPRIISQEGINFVDLEVEAERSSLVDPDRNLVSKTVARTMALLRDGEQTAIGGLYGREVTESRAGIPLLKDLPGWFFGLRYLFGQESRQEDKTELVVLLKVDLVPSVRQRAEQRGAFEIIREKEEDFKRLLKERDENPSSAGGAP